MLLSLMHLPLNVLKLAGVCAAAVALAASSASAGVIAHYSFDTSVTADDSVNGYNLTSVGTVGQVGGQFGSGADFNGSSFLYLNGAQNSAFNIGTGDFALSFWYQSDSSSFQPLVGKNSSGSDVGYATTLSTTVGGDLGDTVGGAVGTARPGTDDDTYQHIVFQSTGGTLQFYLNGSLVSSDPTTSGSNALNTAFSLGTRNISLLGAQGFGGASQKLDGRLDEVWVFDAALSETEIANLMEINSTTVVAVPEPAPLALLGLGLAALGFARRRAR